MNRCRLWLGFCLSWLLVSCSSPTALYVDEPAPASKGSASATSTFTPSVTVDQPSPSPSPGSAGVYSLATATSQAIKVSVPFTTTPTVQPFSLCTPLAEHPLEELPEIISEPYRPPPPGREERHHGVDFSYYRRGERLSIHGSPVQAILPGLVAMSLEDKFPYGNVLIVETPGDSLPPDLVAGLGIDPEESLFLLYAHLDRAPEAALGDRVEACQLLGAVGKSGNAGVAHLHLEARIGPAGEQFSTMVYYDVHATEEEKENYLRWRISGDFRHFDPMKLLSYSY